MHSPSHSLLALVHYDIINHHMLLNRWRPITDPRQVERSALQIYCLGYFKYMHILRI